MEDYTSRGDFFTVNDDKEEDGWGGCYEVGIYTFIIAITFEFSYFRAL